MSDILTPTPADKAFDEGTKLELAKQATEATVEPPFVQQIVDARKADQVTTTDQALQQAVPAATAMTPEADPVTAAQGPVMPDGIVQPAPAVTTETTPTTVPQPARPQG